MFFRLSFLHVNFGKKFAGGTFIQDLRGDRGSGVIFACDIQMKVPIAGVSTLFAE